MSLLQTVVHWAIVLNLLVGFLAALYMVFVVYRVAGKGLGPMGSSAKDVPHEFFVQRRLYGLEAWLCFGFLSIYLALTWMP